MGKPYRECFEWNDAAIRKVTLLWNAEPQLSAATIARMMPVSKNALVGKANRLNLTPRPSPINISGAGNASSRESRLKRDKNGKLVGAAALLTTVSAPSDRDIPPDAAPFVRRVKLCDWPMWASTKRPTHEYCCKEVEPGRRYCEGHNIKAFGKQAAGRAPSLEAA
jgi:GcrA cell cycle regulator